MKSLVALASIIIAMTALPASAQVQRSFHNLGFEQPDLVTNGCRVYINSAQVPGWQTRAPARWT